MVSRKNNTTVYNKICATMFYVFDKMKPAVDKKKLVNFELFE